MGYHAYRAAGRDGLIVLCDSCGRVGTAWIVAEDDPRDGDELVRHVMKTLHDEALDQGFTVVRETHHDYHYCAACTRRRTN